jgi:hypothetical protein
LNILLLGGQATILTYPPISVINVSFAVGVLQ